MKPYKCPICEGRGIVPGGFYNTTVSGGYSVSTNTTEQCRSCMGSGIMWGTEENPNSYLGGVYGSNTNKQTN